MKPEISLFLSDSRGVYIPRDFAKSIKRDCVKNVSPDEWQTLEAGPDADSYWDVWSDVLDFAEITDPVTGVVYTLHQDGDLWLIPQGMEWNDSRGCWEWPFEGESFTGPACWASYLVKGDASGLSDEDRAQADAASAGLGACVDAIEIGFKHRPDYGLAGDCCEYRFWPTKGD